MATSIELTFLGTSSGTPSTTRNVSSSALRLDGEFFLFDCGEGTQHQLIRCAAVKPSKITRIFITHLHGDHCYGLPGLMCSLSLALGKKGGGGDDEAEPGHAPSPSDAASSPPEGPPLHIYGPVGLAAFIRYALLISSARLSYDFAVHELVPPPDLPLPDEAGMASLPPLSGPVHPDERGSDTIPCGPGLVWSLFEDERCSVSAGFLKHGVISFGYVIQEKERPGKLDAGLLKKLGVPPGPLYGALKAGKDVTLPDGRAVAASEVVGPPIPGRKIAILGDTFDASALVPLAQGADLVVHETTHGDELREKCAAYGHSTPAGAAAFARACAARALCITHFSARYAAGDEEGGGGAAPLLQQAREAFGGPVVAARDFLTVPVPSRQPAPPAPQPRA